jgi:hypothetical protein
MCLEELASVKLKNMHVKNNLQQCNLHMVYKCVALCKLIMVKWHIKALGRLKNNQEDKG